MLTKASWRAATPHPLAHGSDVCQSRLCDERLGAEYGVEDLEELGGEEGG
jgi:hypothetical protein